MSSIFSKSVTDLETKLDELLTRAGWTDRRFGSAAWREFYVAKTGDIKGEHIGLWSRDSHDGALALWDITEPVEVIFQEILDRTMNVPYPRVDYVTNACGEVHTGSPSDELLAKVPVEDGPGAVLVYLVELDEVPFVLGNLEVPYRAKVWEDIAFPEEGVVEAACKLAVAKMRMQAEEGVIVFPMDHEDMPDRCVISVAVPVTDDDSCETVKARLANAFMGYEGIDKLYEKAD